MALTRRKKSGRRTVWLSASFVVLPLEEFLLRFSLSLSLFLLMAEFSITHFWAHFSLGIKQQDSA